MKQALHIFRKDVKRLRPELLVMAGLLVACCVVTPQTWVSAGDLNLMLTSVGSLLKVLLPMMWLVLIARVVQEERLAGEQQFWVTRPYAWGPLLAAKALFVVVWVMLPFIVMQWVVLLEAGLRPWTDPVGMLQAVVKLGLVLWLPFFAVAAVTLDLSRTFITVLGVIVEWAAILMLFGGAAGAHTSAPFTPEVLASVTGALMVACVVYAYRTRRTKETRLALVGTSVVFFALLGCLVGVYLQGVTNVLMRWHYPVNASSGLKLVMHPEMAGVHGEAQSAPNTSDWVTVHLPLLVEGVAEGEHLHDTSGQFTLDAAGYHYTSPWRPMIPKEDGISLDIPAKVFARVRAGAVHVHLSLAATVLTLAETRVVTAQREFDAPGGGHCVLADLGQDNLVCRYGYRAPQPTRVTAMVTLGKCGAALSQHIAGATTLELAGGSRPDPVVEERMELGGQVCPGTPVTFRVSKPAGNVRMEADLAAVVLAPYVLH